MLVLNQWRENGRAATPVPKGQGPQNSDQKGEPRWGPFGSIVISKSCSQTFRPWTPPPPFSVKVKGYALLKVKVMLDLRSS